MANSTSIFVDSNYFIALFNKSDDLHESAKKIAEQIAKEQAHLYVSNYVEIEILTVLTQRVSKQVARAAAISLSNTQHIKRIHVSEEIHNKSLQIFQDLEAKNVSVVDCSILAVLDYTGIKRLLTFDSTDFKPLREKFNFSIVT